MTFTEKMLFFKKPLPVNKVMSIRYKFVLMSQFSKCF